MGELSSGHLAIRALRGAGVEHLFTLSGGHLFPFYDGCRHEGVRIVDTRHEQTAVFAAEGLAKLTRRPQVAALTAGPGVTNGMSAIASARFSGSPVLVLGGRAPQGTWGRGGLQEIDHVAFMKPVTKHAATSTAAEMVPRDVLHALRIAAAPHRGPAFVDVPMDVVFAPAGERSVPPWMPPPAVQVNFQAVGAVATSLRAAHRPVVVAGSDVWLGGAEEALRDLAESVDLPVVANGMGRGCLPADHDLAISRARRTALGEADLVVVVGAPLDFRLGYGDFGAAAVVHIVDHPTAIARHVDLAGVVAGDLRTVLLALADAAEGDEGADRRATWAARLRDAEASARLDEGDVLATDTTPIHPARVYGELRQILERDAVVIGDGGDFVSFAGKYVDSYTPGCWLDPGPYGCLGTGLGYAIAARLARPDAQVVALLGDGAAGFGLMDVDTLVRHDLPLVMICGNNGIWGLEKHPMQQLYGGWDAAADLQSGLRYDQVVQALGGDGETIDEPAELGPALRRAFDSGVPYLVNVLTDPAVAYPRRTALA
ncbi:MAG: acetolactate synthase [Egibacteraceae bacterium]